MLEGLPGAFCHMYDILIRDLLKQNTRLTEVCKNCGMTLNAKKFVFSPNYILFLDHVLDGEGVHLDPDEIGPGEILSAVKEQKGIKVAIGHDQLFIKIHS